jgi:lysophospholipase
MTGAAPFFAEVAEGPRGARAAWARAEDGTRLRVVIWPGEFPGGARGTVLLFPGRTEYCEKYGRTVADLAAMGLSVATIDWRGQGLADRALTDLATGHVTDFTDYQMDVAALLSAAREAGLAEPFHLLAHSMGGAIGLRALMQGLPVRSAVFSAPMWGIRMEAALRPLAWSLSWASRHFGFGHRYAPGTRPASYLAEAAFEGNMLTTDREMWGYMQRQVAAHPELSLGGPSLHWLYEALAETRRLARRPAPQVPALTFLGTRERIVDLDPIHARMSRWPGGRLELVEGAEHEVLMEGPQVRARVMAQMGEWFGLETVAG